MKFAQKLYLKDNLQKCIERKNRVVEYEKFFILRRSRVSTFLADKAADERVRWIGSQMRHLACGNMQDSIGYRSWLGTGVLQILKIAQSEYYRCCEVVVVVMVVVVGFRSLKRYNTTSPVHTHTPSHFRFLIPCQLRIFLTMSLGSWHCAPCPGGLTFYSSLPSTIPSSFPPPPPSISSPTLPARRLTAGFKQTATLAMASVVNSQHPSTVPVRASSTMAAPVSTTCPWSRARPVLY